MGLSDELRRLAIAVTATLLVLVGFGGDASSATAGRVSAGPPAWWREYYPLVGLGDGLLAIGDTTRGDRMPQVRRADGTWVRLPRVPDRGAYGATALRDTVLAVGRSCSWDCGSGQLRMFLWSPEDSNWTRLAVPELTLDSETELVIEPGASEHVVVFVGGTWLAVDREGGVRELPPSPPDTRIRCVHADSLSAIAHPPLLGGPDVGPEVRVLRLDDPEPAWTPVGTAPPGSGAGTSPAQLCGPDTVTLFDGATQSTYRVSTGTWSSGLSNLLDVAGADVVPGSWSAQVAWSPDGQTAFIVAAGRRVLARTGDGSWVDTGRTAWALTATSSAVFAYEPDAAEPFVELWPPA